MLSLLSSSALCQSAFNPKKAHYAWPTSASHALSSTFGETRAGHFHAALDIKTWGRRGYPVYATRSGTLFRLAIGPRGYGNVLYLKHDDGSYSVYAHLLRFKKSIQQWADSVRLQHYTSSIDAVVDSLHIHIKQGEQIGLSGASGIGPPHLHFELRTPENKPFNPLLTNLKVKDTRPPVFQGLAVEPLNINSTIEGSNRIFTKRVSRAKRKAHFGTVHVRGEVGLAVNVFDHANGVHNPYAVYKLQLKVDGDQVFQSKVDRFSYQETHQMDLDRVYPLLQKKGKAYQRLYIRDGNTLSFYHTRGNGGRLQLPAGTHHIAITASDYFGNSRKATLTLRVKKSSPRKITYKNPPLNEASQQITPAKWIWHNNWVNIPKNEFSQLIIAPLFSPFPNSIFYHHGNKVGVSLKGNAQMYFGWGAHEGLLSRRVKPDEPAYVVSPNKKAFAAFPKHSFYDTVSVAISAKSFTPESLQVKLFPDNHPIHKAYHLSINIDSLPRLDSTLSFYHYYPKSDYLRKLPTTKKGTYVTTSPSSLGTFLILSDTTAPSLGRPKIVRRPDGMWLVYVPAHDNRSGIDYQRSKFYVNGLRGLTEYQPAHHRLVYYLPAFTPKRRNEMKIIAYDKEGNKTEKRVVIRH